MERLICFRRSFFLSKKENYYRLIFTAFSFRVLICNKSRFNIMQISTKYRAAGLQQSLIESTEPVFWNN